MTLANTGDDMLDELGLLLARYADTVLRPDPAAMDRIRSELRARAQRASVRRRAESMAVATMPAGAIAPARRPFARWTVRKVALALAASLMLGASVGTSAFAASRAGGPLYELRVGLETLTLPSDPEDRLAAELERAEARLAEAQEAAARGDLNAVAAALAAFERIMDETGPITAEDGASKTALERIAQHQAILAKLLTLVPPQAQDAVRRAQDKSDNAAKDLRTPPPGQGNEPQGPKKTDAPGAVPGGNDGSGDPGAGGNGGSGDPGGGNGNPGGNPGGGGGGQGPPAGPGAGPGGAGGEDGASGQGDRSLGVDKTKGP
jgi:hypothetical protein